MVDTSAHDDPERDGPSRDMMARLAAPLLWLCFAALVLAGAWLFLRACALDALGLDYCPVRAQRSVLMGEAAIGTDLARQVHMAQLALAEAPLCPAPSVAPRPDAAPRRAETEAIDKTVVERGGHNGVLQFTLSWATLDDLDLNVDCPGGRIDSQPGHGGPGICGDGRKDIDANRNLTDNVSTSPIENIVWQNDIPRGQYKIEVIEYRAATSAGNTVPFTLRVRWDGKERVCADVVSTTPLSEQQMVNGHVLGGTGRVLTWTFGDDLPECNFSVTDAYRGAADK